MLTPKAKRSGDTKNIDCDTMLEGYQTNSPIIQDPKRYFDNPELLNDENTINFLVFSRFWTILNKIMKKNTKKIGKSKIETFPNIANFMKIMYTKYYVITLKTEGV